jgi:hypothetical protein
MANHSIESAKSFNCQIVDSSILAIRISPGTRCDLMTIQQSMNAQVHISWDSISLWHNVTALPSVSLPCSLISHHW